MKPSKLALTPNFIAATCLTLGLCASTFAQSTPSAPQGGPMAGQGHEHHREGPAGIKRLDKNGDGMISREEAKGHPRLEKEFDAIDANKDGQLSSVELKAFGDKMREQHKGEGKHGDKHGEGHAHGGSPMKRLDTNNDGKLSRDEVKGHPMLEKNFDRIDTNKDGFLTEEELKAARKAEMEARMKNKGEASK